MPIITLQRRLREIGRIRAGTKSDKGAPTKLTTWRLTSAQQSVIEQAATLWGGKVEPWDSPNGPQWQVITNTDSLRVIIPNGQSATQYYESWKGGGCVRRCDGQTELLSDVPCLCDPDPERRECKPITRLNVMLPDLSDLGQWRLDTGSWYGAGELGGVADLLASANAEYVPARLRLEQRSVKRPGKPTNRFAVPVIEMDFTLGDVLESLGIGSTLATSGTGRLEGGVPERPALAAATATPPVASDDDWSELYSLVGVEVDAAATMPTIESEVRRTFVLMERVGLWHPLSDGTDALHAALRKHADVEHVGDLRKDGLVAFARVAREAAREAVGKVAT
jgi:hypothetical protein